MTIELMEVEARFLLSKVGLVLFPGLAMTSNIAWQDFSATILVITPAGESHALQADFKATHFNYNSSINTEGKRWKITVVLPTATPDLISIGSKVWCSHNVKTALGISTL